jgi:hypothetical protein
MCVSSTLQWLMNDQYVHVVFLWGLVLDARVSVYVNHSVNFQGRLDCDLVYHKCHNVDNVKRDDHPWFQKARWANQLSSTLENLCPVQSQSNKPIMTKDSITNGPFLNILTFHRKDFLKDFFCNMFLKILTSAPMNYITFKNSFWVNMNFF